MCFTLSYATSRKLKRHCHSIPAVYIIELFLSLLCCSKKYLNIDICILIVSLTGSFIQVVQLVAFSSSPPNFQLSWNFVADRRLQKRAPSTSFFACRFSCISFHKPGHSCGIDKLQFPERITYLVSTELSGKWKMQIWISTKPKKKHFRKLHCLPGISTLVAGGGARSIMTKLYLLDTADLEQSKLNMEGECCDTLTATKGMSRVPEKWETSIIVAEGNNQKTTLLHLKLSDWMKWEAIWSLIFFPS